MTETVPRPSTVAPALGIPATPASHGCVRIPYPEAVIVYAFAKVGTAVYVY